MNEYTLWGKLNRIRTSPPTITLAQLLPIIQDALPAGYIAHMGWGADDERALVVCSPRDPPYSYGGQVGRIFGKENTGFDRKLAEHMVNELLHEINLVEENHKSFRWCHPNITKWEEIIDAPGTRNVKGMTNSGGSAGTKSDGFVSLMRVLVASGAVVAAAAMFDSLLKLHV